MFTQKNTRRLITAALALLATLAAAPLAPAAVRTWSASDGQFNLGFNWSGGVAPGMGDAAILDQAWADYDLWFSPYLNITNDWLRVEDGTYDLDLGGKIYTLTSTQWLLPTTRSINMGIYGGDPTLVVRHGRINAEHALIANHASSDALLIIEADATLDMDGSLVTGAGFGRVRVYGGEVSMTGLELAGGFNSNGLLDVSGGSLDVSNTAPVKIGNRGHGALQVGGGATASVAGDMTLGVDDDADGSLTVFGGEALDIGGTVTVGDDGEGQVMMMSGGHISSGDLSVTPGGGTGSVTILDAGSRWDVDGQLNISWGGEVFIDQGCTVDVSGFTGISSINTNLTIFGTLRTGSFGAFPAVVDFHQGSTIELTDDDFEVSPNGPLGQYVTFEESTLIVSGACDVQEPNGGEAVLTAWGGEITIEGNCFVVRDPGGAGQLVIAADVTPGTMSIGGDLHLGGDAFGAGGDADADLNSGATLEVDGTVTVYDDGLIEQDHDTHSFAKHLDVAGGTFDHAGGQLRIGDDPVLAPPGTNSFVVHGENEASVTVRDGGTLITGGGLIAYGEGTVGSMTVTGPGSEWQTTFQVSIAVGTPAGSASDGSLTIADGGHVDVPSDVYVYGDTRLSLDNGSLTAQNVRVWGRLEGNGTIDANLVHHGVLAPGNSPGLLKFAGNNAGMTTQYGSSLEVELAGDAASQFDRIEVASSITINGGTVHVSTIDGFVPSSGQMFPFLVATNGVVIGMFDSIEPAGQYALVYTPAAVFIETLAPPCGADLDGSGHVGFDDLALLLGAWGPCGQLCASDLDASGHVGFDDLALVLGAWGTCPSR